MTNQFIELEKEYIKFRENIEKGALANSPQKYLMQRGYELKLSQIADNEQLKEKYLELLSQSEKKLNEFGIKFK